MNDANAELSHALLFEEEKYNLAQKKLMST